MSLIRVASYNIHCGIGCDGSFEPARIRDVLAEIDADIVALQEVEARTSRIDMLAWLAGAMGFEAAAGPTLARPDGHYGNAVLVRGRIATVDRFDLSVPGREPRGAIAANVECRGAQLRVVATHLGLAPAERRHQVMHLLRMFDRTSLPGPAILAGDLNEWYLWGRPLRWLHAHFEETPTLATFPSRMPVFALDRIWASPRSMLRAIRVHRSALARRASDHLPIVAELELDGAENART